MSDRSDNADTYAGIVSHPATAPGGAVGYTIPPSIPWLDLNQSFFAFAAALPSLLSGIAVDSRLYSGKSNGKILVSLKEVHPLVTCLPWLFREAFHSLKNEDLLAIGEASQLLFLAMLLNDADEDGQLPDTFHSKQIHQHLTNGALSRFKQLFATDSNFWVYFDEYFQLYSKALIANRQHQGQLLPYSLEEMYKIASGKVALFKVIPAGLAVLSGNENLISSFNLAVDSLMAALQLGDDILDWREDYCRKNYTLPLALVIPSELRPQPNLDVEEIGMLFEQATVLEHLLIQTKQWLHNAQDAISELNCMGWSKFVESCQVMTSNYHRNYVMKKVASLMRVGSTQKSDSSAGLV